MKIQLKHFLTGDWENLQEEFFLQPQVLTSSSSMPPTQHDLPTHKCFFRSLVLGHVGEYF